MIRRIGRVGRRGRARIINAAKSDNNATIAAARHSYSRLIRRHVELYEYQPAKLHTKLAIVDDIVHIGSSNFDYRSFYINLEIMLRIKDADFADAMRGYFERELADCKWITPELHKRRASRWRRFKWAMSHFLVNVMDYTVTRRLNFVSARPALPLIGPEQGRGGHVDPFEPTLDRREMRLDEIAHLRAELIDEERAARADHLRRRFGDVVAHARRKGREGKAREHIIG